ncbi:MFS transporter [Gordonia sp. (in: high G+C Gram-positive bacteria)]|uniref:MFS transporter n=1 Tax=Gordonia sp. (in: high G+C Gram-positive bacteria) TaxID=84139 RepID=UPI003C75D256
MTSTLAAPEVVAVQRKTLWTVVISQAFGGAGLAAGIAVGALIAADMLGGDSLSGLPTAMFTLGSALTAFLIGRVTNRIGRRGGLGAGFTAGGVGAVGVVVATAISSPVLLFASLFVYGAGSATNLQARYAGTDLAAEDHRGRAISIAMIATTLGAVAGPNLIEPTGKLAEAVGLPALSGPFVLAAAAYLIAGGVLFAMLRPDPYLLARRLSSADDEATTAVDRTRRNLRRPAIIGAFVMIVTQGIMVAVMTMTPVHMNENHHSLGAIGLVIGFHIGAMWLPSLVTGQLVDRVGARVTAIAAGMTLLVAGLLAMVSPPQGLFWLIVALSVLGLGWNLGLIAGTALVVEGTDPASRAQTQGSIDVWVNVIGAVAGVGSGLVMNAVGYGTLAIAAGVLALVVVPAVMLGGRRRQPSDS